MRRATMAAGVLLLLFGVGCGLRPAAEKPAPTFALETLDGEDYRLADCQGRVCLLSVWATWCPPCIEEIPHFNDLSRRYEGDLLILGVTVDDDLERLRGALDEHGPEYPIVLAEDEFLSAIEFTGILPTSILVGPEGKVQGRFLGWREPEFLESEIRRVLKLKPLQASKEEG